MLSSIENFYERLVMDCIHEILDASAEISDPDYLDDLACVALNKLPPRYVRHSIDMASHLGDDELTAMKRDVSEAVGSAIETIARRRKARDS